MMKTKIWGSEFFPVIKSHMLSIIFFSCILVFIIVAIRQTEIRRNAEGIRLTEESIQRAVISCYALEGRYPQDLQYIRENYGVSIDEEKFFVAYEVFASNLMPEITVIERNAEEYEP